MPSWWFWSHLESEGFTGLQKNMRTKNGSDPAEHVAESICFIRNAHIAKEGSPSLYFLLATMKNSPLNGLTSGFFLLIAIF